MISNTIKYTNFLDEPKETTAWFHLDKLDVIEHLDEFLPLQGQLEAIVEIFKGEARDITPEEIRKILNLTKAFAKLSYGERSADGERFIKDGAWDRFYETAAYKQLLTDFFDPDPTKAFEFMLAVMPKNLQNEALAVAKEKDPELYAQYQELQNGGIVTQERVLDLVETETERTKKPQDMTKEELLALMADHPTQR
jgi:hypothetical protein